MEFIKYFISEIDTVWKYLLEHIYMTSLTVMMSIIIGVPLGIIVYYYRKTSKIIMNIANVIQAIPSMALLGFAIPLLGIGKIPSIVVVTMYSLLPIIKNTYIGIKNINIDTIEAAKGMGLTKSQILYKIQVPIALPVIMGGVRVSAVTSVGLVTIAALIGGGGLGYLIYSGMVSVDSYKILSGALPACILALIVDFGFGKIEHLLDYKRKIGVKKKKRKKTLQIAIGAIVVVLLIASQLIGNKSNDIVIGGKDFTEQGIIVNLVSELIEEKTDLNVKKQTNLGSTTIVFEAIKNGDLDMYIDYTGTVYLSILKHSPNSDPEKVYNIVSKDLKKKYGLITGKSFGFNNTYTLSVTQETAKKYNLEKISDLDAVADKLTLGAAYEFVNRPDGIEGIEKNYGIKFKDSVVINGSPRYSALVDGKSDVMDAFKTDGLIKKYNLKILEDDKNSFPPYYAIPIVREDTLKKYPELKKIMKILENNITDEEMQEMNYKVDELREKPEAVAKKFLKSKKLIK